MTGTGVLKGFGFDGEPLWSLDLQATWGAFGILHGYSSSPLLHGDSLYVQVLHGFHTDDPSYLMRIDKRTGEVRWRVERPTDAPREAPDAYTTPAVLERGEAVEIVVSGADYVTGHDPRTGREVWRVPGLNPSANPMQRVVASPVVSGSMILVPSRVDPLLALDASGDGVPRVAWSTSRGPDVPTPVVTERFVFILTDNGIVWCLDAASGDVVWGPERVESSTYSASPVVADGKLYVTNESGLTTVVEAGPEFRILGRSGVDEYTLSSLAVAGGQLFLRTAEHLYCIGEAG
jgi:outer membrane protein assembly factor BamB